MFRLKLSYDKQLHAFFIRQHALYVENYGGNVNLTSVWEKQKDEWVGEDEKCEKFKRW